MACSTSCLQLALLVRMIVIGADAHGQLTVPRVRSDPEGREVSHKQRAPVYTLNGPTGGYSATSMRCHDFNVGQLTTVTAGTSLTVTHTMEAAHPGDCYLYISYDGPNPVNFFKIAAIKGCGAPDGVTPPTPYSTTIDLPAALPSCDHCVLRWEWTAHQQVVNIEFYVQCADIKIVSNAGPTKPSPMIAISGIEHLPSSASSYRNPYNGQFGDDWLVGPDIASFLSCSVGSSGCIGIGAGTGTTTTGTSATTISSGFPITSSTASATAAIITSTATMTATTRATTDPRTTTSSVSRSGLPTSTTIWSTTEGGSCDMSCVDILDVAVCREADIIWNMCSVSSPWWISRCQATCAKCNGVSPPCGQCDHKCADTRSECDRLNHLSAGALCSGGWGVWWKNQCKASCGACDGVLPVCSQAMQLNSFSMSVPTGVAPNNGTSSGAQGTTLREGDNKTVLVLLGISNGVLLLSLFLSWYTMSRRTKTFTV